MKGQMAFKIVPMGDDANQQNEPPTKLSCLLLHSLHQ
jgi:hypothetical protein